MTTARRVAIAIGALGAIGTISVQRGWTRVPLIGSLLGIRNGYLHVRREEMHGGCSVVGRTIAGAVSAVGQGRRWHGLPGSATIHYGRRAIWSWII